MKNGFWKGFFIALGAAVAAVLYALFQRPRGVQPGGSPAKIAEDAQRKIEETRKDIAADTDEELAARFNRLAKKEKKE